jgi:signal transduction histidine kinase
MTPEQFNALVSSKRSADRRLAGREIVANPTLVDRTVIEGAFHRETVPQIRQQFGAALEFLNGQGARSPEPPAAQAEEIYNEAYVKAVRSVTERVLHQLNPLIGDIEQSASAEIKSFDDSETKKRIGQIKLQADAITKLYNSAKPAVFEEFDLAALIRNCLPHDLAHTRCLLSFAGPAPLIVQGDPSLIVIAVTNGLRNAIEASLPVATQEHKPSIIVNWNATDRDYWISILDEGVGYRGSIPGAFEIGSTTKEGHSGHGLPGIKAAMLSLSGSADLIPQEERGCVLTLSWPIIEAKE